MGTQWSGLALFFWRTSCIMTFIFFTPLVAFEFKVHFLHLKSISEDLNLSWLMLVVYYRHLHLSLNLGGHWGSTTSFLWFTLFPLPSGFHEPWAWPVHSVLVSPPPSLFTIVKSTPSNQTRWKAVVQQLQFFLASSFTIVCLKSQVSESTPPLPWLDKRSLMISVLGVYSAVLRTHD